MTAYHTDFDATHAHIGAADDMAQRLENIARRAEIMAELYADRRLSPATGCAAANTSEGWPAGMLQDDSSKFSKWLADKPGARRHARAAAAVLCSCGGCADSSCPGLASRGAA